MTRKLGDNYYRVPPEKKRTGENGRRWQAVLGQYLGLTSQNLGVIGFLGLVGWYLDRRWSTEPYLLAVGLILGAAIGFYVLIRSLLTVRDNARK